ncbi:hypothetical protein AAKU58_004363 [Oxalobacteraceae bacterium GrIS 1.18]
MVIPTLSNSDLHKLIPVHTRKVNPKTIRPADVARNREEVAAPYLQAFHCVESALASISAAEAIKLVAKYTPTQLAMIYAGFLLATQETSFPLLPEDKLYKVDVSLKDHVKSIADLAAEAPILIKRSFEEIWSHILC